jgi:hypothetical protein
MARIAYSYGFAHIQAIDLRTNTQASLQYLTHNAAQFDISDDGVIYYVMRNGHKQIHTAKIGWVNKTDTLCYEHPTYIRDVAVRSVNGRQRVYFSMGSGSSGVGVIYYLSEQNTPIEYYVINPKDIMVYNSCTCQEDHAYYRGDFTFGDNNTLYISNGNVSPCGIYRISGAGPDSVTGGVERIYLSNDAIQGLTCDQEYLYFYNTAKQIVRLDLKTLQSETVYTLNVGGIKIIDLSLVPDQVSWSPSKWNIIKSKLFSWIMNIIYKTFMDGG